MNSKISVLYFVSVIVFNACRPGETQMAMALKPNNDEVTISTAGDGDGTIDREDGMTSERYTLTV